MAMLCLRLPFTVTSPENWVRITRGKEQITPKVLEKCSQNTELRRNAIPLRSRLNAVKTRNIYSTLKGSVKQGHDSSKAQKV